ncbi:MAG TPA: transcription antitermination factor NusB [Polyangiaceae bacterium]|jgi:16S rRNA (cytosine967-C5)-methyltransferase|nr:transcription antitermination factor NusB [Polyangiaceae bacterium]
MKAPEATKSSSARVLAVRVLERVERDGAYAAAALDAELDRHPQLDARDRGLTSELVYGVLRTRGALTERLLAHAPRGIADALVRRHLEVAAYQILLLDRVPAFAAVDEAIGDLKRARGPRVAGFGNAVLRKLAREPKLDPTLAVRASAPSWLFAKLEAAVGEREAEALLGAGVAPGRLWARVAGKSAPAWLEAAERHVASPLARRLPGGDPEKLEGFSDGAFVVQEPGAQLVGLALGARPGERVLDACAGRGQKTTLLRDAVGEGGEVWASDAHPKKLEALARELTRLGGGVVQAAAVDWTLGAGSVPADFERVLVDAPCTGTGTLRRRPEIGLRLAPEDPARLAELQAAILRGAATRARPGGRVVYAVCSVLGEEAEAVVARVTDLLEPAPFDAPALAALAPAGATALRLTPLAHDTDGYFVASFVRK